MFIPGPEETGIKVLALDQGGIYIGVDYYKTVEALRALGATNADALYTQADQTDVVDQFERGAIPRSDFYQYLRSNLDGLREDVSDQDLYDAWNAMLTGVVPGVLEFIQTLRNAGYITVVVSNADHVHQDGVEEQLTEAGVKHLFDEVSFDERYISYQIGYNKPYVDIFEYVTADLQKKYTDLSLQPEEILFFDDSEKHIVGRREKEGAERIGWKGCLVPSNLPVEGFASVLNRRLLQLSHELTTSCIPSCS